MWAKFFVASSRSIIQALVFHCTFSQYGFSPRQDFNPRLPSTKQGIFTTQLGRLVEHNQQYCRLEVTDSKTIVDTHFITCKALH